MLAAKQMWPLSKQAFTSWSEDKVPRLAAALAYYTAISMAPLLVLSVIFLERVASDAPGKVQNQMQMLMGESGKNMANEMIKSAQNSSGGTVATVISFVILLFGASGVFGELQDAMNTIWEVKPKPNAGWKDWLRKRFLSMAAVFGVGFILLVSLAVSTILGAVVHRIAGEGKVVGFLLDAILTVMASTLLFAGIFRLLPDVKIAWRDVFHGAVLTAVLFTIGKYALTIYLTKGSTTSAYGAAGSLAAVLIWVYYSAQILYFGAEFTQVYANEYGSKIVPSEYAEPLTAEARRQQGMEPKPTAPAGPAGEQGSRMQPAHGRQVVTIEQPAVMNRQGYLLAAGGVAAGLIVGAAGVLTGRKYGEPRLKAEEVDQRIKAIEARVGQKKRDWKRYARELEIQDRVEKMEEKVSEATTRVRRQALKNEWYNRIKSYVG